MSTSYSAVFGYGFVIKPDDVEKVGSNFVDMDDSEGWDDWNENSTEYLESVLKNYPDLGLKVELSYNLMWDDCTSFLIGINFVDDWEPWGGPVPLIDPPTVQQQTALLEVISRLGLNDDGRAVPLMNIYGITVG